MAQDTLGSQESPQTENKLLRSFGITPRRLTWFTLAVIFLISTDMLMLYHSLQVVRHHESWVAHTNQVIHKLDLKLAAIKDAISSSRGFILSANPVFLNMYEDARSEAKKHARDIRTFIGDNPSQLLILLELERTVDELLAWQVRLMNVVREAKDAKAIEEAKDIMSFAGEVREKIATIQSLIASVQQEEERLLKEREKQANKAADRLDLALLASALLSLLLVMVAQYFIRRALKHQAEESHRLIRENWLKGGVSEFTSEIRGKATLAGISQGALKFFAQYIGAQVGALYVLRNGMLHRSAVLAHADSEAFVPENLEISESLIGESVRNNQIIDLKDIPGNYIKIRSSLGDVTPRRLIIFPIINVDEVVASVELGFLGDLPPDTIELFGEISEALGPALSVAISRELQQELLEETQRQAEELVMQQEELRANNEELEAHTAALRSSQERLQIQQEELRQTNEELEQQARAVEKQREALARRNNDLAQAKASLESKTAELEEAGRYKSEFLANMSHELRTPLNSLLLLATLLEENEEKSMTPKQVEFARAIHKSGHDLLALINDILDLSKVEAGHLDLNPERVDLQDIRTRILQDFIHVAEDKELVFSVTIARGMDETIHTDRQRLEQILRNLLSNAIKFTSKGEVSLTIEKGEDSNFPVLFKVKDTGIGIAADKQEQIFEAFKQGDGSISRSYGGTGLGLTISRELTNLLQGNLTVQSSLGKGSLFTLALPKEMIHVSVTPARKERTEVQRITPPILIEKKAVAVSDSTTLQYGPDDRVVLIVEDDPIFGRLLAELAREKGFHTVVAARGETALALAQQHTFSAVLLDIKLPDMSGFNILESLKAASMTRHIPVHVVSGADYVQNALALGAMGYLLKPAKKKDLLVVFERIESILDRKVRRILVIEDDKFQRNAIRDLLGNGDLEIVEAIDGKEARAKLAAESYDCVVLDLKLPDISGFEILEELQARPSADKPPVVVYTAKDLTKEEQDKLERYAESIIIKGARSPERLLDEVSLFLHRVESSLPPDSQAILQKLRSDAEGLKERKVLLVDDDMRNIFALANALEANEVRTVIARNGREALEKLDSDSEIELVLMDIMMPEMDGFEAMKRIRRNPVWKKLPIIALTAKAMKGDLEKCLDAGANDYLPKPISLERLLSLLKVWLPQKV